MTNECRECYAEIPSDRKLCLGCEADQQAAQAQAGEAERVWRERAARAAAVE